MIQRVESGKQNLTPNFIGSWMIESDLCDQLVSYFESNTSKQSQGTTSSGINLKTKDRVDISISPNDIKLPENRVFKICFNRLFDCYKDYNSQWPFLKKWGISTKFFKKYYLKSKTKYNGPLKEPNVTIGYILGLLSCKIQSFFTF